MSVCVYVLVYQCLSVKLLTNVVPLNQRDLPLGAFDHVSLQYPEHS